MKHLFVPFKIAKLLKEKGFDEICFGYFDEEILIADFRNGIYALSSIGDDECLAPIHQQVIDWLREKHDMDIEVLRQHDDGKVYSSFIEMKEGTREIFTGVYYEALDKAIEEAVKLI